MRPIDWEHSTFDEVLLVIKGKTDDWRIQRRNAYNLYCVWVKEPVSVYDFAPLMFDDELKNAETKQEFIDLELYQQAIANFDNIVWPEPRKN